MSVEDALALLREDQGVCLLVVWDDVSTRSLEALVDEIERREPTPEIIFVSDETRIPAGLMMLFENAGLAPWLVPRNGRPGEFEETVDRAFDGARCRQALFDHERSTIQRAGVYGNSARSRSEIAHLSRLGRLHRHVLLSGPLGSRLSALSRALHGLQPQRRIDRFAVVRFGEGADDPHLGDLVGNRHSPGLLGRLNGGTLVAESIERASAAHQARLAQLVFDGAVTPVKTLDLRLIAVLDPVSGWPSMGQGLRSDLLNELSAAHAAILPLGEIREDIPFLVENQTALLHQVLEFHHGVSEWEPGALEAMSEWEWPGDREGLAHFVEWCLLMAPTGKARPLGEVEGDYRIWREAREGAAGLPPVDPALRLLRWRGSDPSPAAETALRYAVFASIKRRAGKDGLAASYGRTERWVEIETRRLADWSLGNGHRTEAELLRDGLLPRRRA